MNEFEESSDHPFNGSSFVLRQYSTVEAEKSFGPLGRVDSCFCLATLASCRGSGGVSPRGVSGGGDDGSWVDVDDGVGGSCSCPCTPFARISARSFSA